MPLITQGLGGRFLITRGLGADATGPYAAASSDGIHVRVVFLNRVPQAEALNPANYTILDTSSNPLPVIGVEYETDKLYILRTFPQVPDQEYLLDVKDPLK